jgi:hypothetical protein
MYMMKVLLPAVIEDKYFVNPEVEHGTSGPLSWAEVMDDGPRLLHGCIVADFGLH